MTEKADDEMFSFEQHTLKFISIKDGLFKCKDGSLPNTNTLKASITEVGSTTRPYEGQDIKYLNIKFELGNTACSLGMNVNTFLARTLMNSLLNADLSKQVKICVSQSTAAGKTYNNIKVMQDNKQVYWKYKPEELDQDGAVASDKLGKELVNLVMGKPKREAQVTQPAINDSFNNQLQQPQNQSYETTGNIPPTKVLTPTENISDSNFEDEIPF